MATIKQLSEADIVENGDQFPFFSEAQGDTRKVTFATLKDSVATDFVSADALAAQTGATLVGCNGGTTVQQELDALAVVDASKVPLSYLDTDGTLAANSDTKVATQRATKTYADTKAASSALSASSGSSLVGFIQSGAGAVARTLQAKARDVVDVRDFGAVGNGVADDTAAIQAAMAAHDVVHFPAGTFRITGTLAMTRAGQALIGAGSRRTEIRMVSTTLAAITLANGVANYTVEGLKVGRTGTPVSGANGIHFLGTTDNSEISDIWCEGHWNGLVIGTCDTGLIHGLRCNKNLAYGVYQTNAVSYGPSQWEVNDALVDRNGIDGWRVESTAGPAGLILGTIHSIKSFANVGRGLHVIGNATTPVFDVRIVNAFLGSDNAGSIRLDTYGGKHRVSGFFERNGRDPTGPTLATPASNAAPGIEISANNIDVVIYGSTIDDNAYDGIQHDGGVLIVSGCNIFNNGQALTGGRRNGILSQGGRLVVGSSALTNLSGNTTQLFGVATSHDDLVISGNDMAGNTSGGATLGGTADAVMIANAPKTLVGYLPATTDALVFNAAYTPTATGGNKGAGTINVATDIYKNNTAYTNP